MYSPKFSMGVCHPKYNLKKTQQPSFLCPISEPTQEINNPFQTAGQENSILKMILYKNHTRFQSNQEKRSRLSEEIGLKTILLRLAHTHSVITLRGVPTRYLIQITSQAHN